MRKNLGRTPAKRTMYFKPGEIEQLCLDELKAADLLPADPSPIRIERFIEKRFKVTPQFEDLPDHILGFTRFGPNGVSAIVISRILSDESTQVADRRLSTTLAHEAGHALLHGSIFSPTEIETELSLDGVDHREQKILCRDQGIAGENRSTPGNNANNFLEVHANRAIGGLLLPKPLVEKALDSILATRGLLGNRVLESDRREDAVAILSKIFEVNPIVARIRLEGMYPVTREDQMSL
jgi:hypothetical protein